MTLIPDIVVIPITPDIIQRAKENTIRRRGIFKETKYKMSDDNDDTGSIGEIGCADYLNIPCVEYGAPFDFWMNGFWMNLKTQKGDIGLSTHYLVNNAVHQMKQPSNILVFARIMHNNIYLLGWCSKEYFVAHSKFSNSKLKNTQYSRYQMPIRLLLPMYMLLDMKEGC